VPDAQPDLEQLQQVLAPSPARAPLPIPSRAGGVVASMASGMGNAAFSRSIATAPARGVTLARKSAMEIDAEMKKQGDIVAAGQARAMVEMVGGASVKTDRAQIAAICATIDAAQPTLMEAEAKAIHGIKGTVNTGMGQSGKVFSTVNQTTRFQLEQLDVDTAAAGTSTSQFQRAAELANADYGRIMGAAAGALIALGIKPDRNQTSIVKDAFEGMPNVKVPDPDNPGQMKEQGPLAGQVDRLENSSVANFKALERFRTARTKLNDTQREFIKSKGTFESGLLGYSASMHKAAAAAATASAEKDQEELDGIRKEIDQVAKGAGMAAKIGLAALAQVAPTISAPGAGSVVEGAGAAKGTTVQAYVPPSSGASAAESAGGFQTGKEVDALKEATKGKALDPTTVEGVVKAIGEYANADKIGKLTGKIGASKHAAKLHTAQAELELSQKAIKDVDASMKEFVRLAGLFAQHYNEMTAAAEAAIGAAKRSGNPNVAMALRFLAETDKFLATVKVAIDAGERDREKAIKAATDAHRMEHGDKDTNTAVYYTVRKEKASGWNADDIGSQIEVYKVEKHDVEFQEGGAGSLRNTPADVGTPGRADSGQVSVRRALDELKGRQAEIEGLAAQVQRVTGMGAPGESA
jgi:hypothetical protein